jgi:hypothetical protein
LTGTGFAPPKMKPPVAYPIAGSRMVMTGSMCGIGLSVIRPRSRAVGSPHCSATQPWAASWIPSEITSSAITSATPIGGRSSNAGRRKERRMVDSWARAAGQAL